MCVCVGVCVGVAVEVYGEEGFYMHLLQPNSLSVSLSPVTFDAAA